jgi:tol-pal system protein YbgF
MAMIMRRNLILSALAALLAAAPGCMWVTTKADGNRIQRRVTAIDKRLATQEAGFEGKVEKLQKVLDEATTLLARNSANIGDEVKALDEDLREVRGLLTAAKRYAEDVQKEVDELEKSLAEKQSVLDLKLANLDQRLLAIEDKLTKPVAQTADELWTQGKAAFDAGDYNTARNLFKQLVISFPGHGRADDGQYYRGESYFLEKDYDGAIREFQKLFDKFADSSWADDAWFRAGEAAIALKRCTEARAYFGELRRRQPDSPLADKANAKIKELTKAEKDPKKCLR